MSIGANEIPVVQTKIYLYIECVILLSAIHYTEKCLEEENNKKTRNKTLPRITNI